MTIQSNTSAQIQAADNALQRSYTRSGGASDKMGKDDFLKLMMAQVTHQDPLNPMDSQGMMQQLTGMSSLEQLVNINSGLGELRQTQDDVLRANTFAYLDKDVSLPGGGVSVNRGAAPGMQFRLEAEAEQVLVSISRADGVPVRSLEMGAMGPGAHAIAWDAADSDGRPVPDGFYRFSVNARSVDEQSVPVEQYVRGKVSGVRFDNGRPKLTVNGAEVDIRDVVEMSNRSQRLFSGQVPAGLRQEIAPQPLATRRSQ